MNFERIYHTSATEGLLSPKDFYSTDKSKLNCDYFLSQKKIHFQKGYHEKNKKCISEQEYNEFIRKSGTTKCRSNSSFLICETVFQKK